MADLVDFIFKSLEDQGLLDEFLKVSKEVKNSDELSDWFKKKGFYISCDELDRIFDNKSAIDAKSY